MNFKEITIGFLVGSTVFFATSNISEAYVREKWSLPSKSATYK